MDRIIISKAIYQLEEFVQILDNAYWESSSIPQKDHFFDLIRAFQLEVSELAKLSVEDHYMAYEPITIQIKNTLNKLKDIQSNADQWTPRTKTAEQLNDTLPDVIRLLTPQP